MIRKRYLGWVVGTIGLMLALGASFRAFGFSTHTEEWSEEALLQDGRTIKVDREVYWMFHLISGDEASLRVMESDPDRYGIKFKNPDTGETIKWEGEEGFSPVLLDIVDKVPYLVVQGPDAQAYYQQYVCPEVPYIFLKYERGFFSGKWASILPKQFPGPSKLGNLSPTSPSDIEDYGQAARGGKAMMQYVYKPKRFLSHADIVANISYFEGHSAGQIHALIPTECPAWRSRKSPSWPAPIHVPLEILETDNITPPVEMHNTDAFNKFTDKKRGNSCAALIKPLDSAHPYNTSRMRFVNDATGENEAPAMTFSPRFIVGELTCDKDSIWFEDNTEWNRVGLFKFTHAGKLLYRVVFDRPAEPDKKYRGFIATNSVVSKDGNLYFDWPSSTETNATGLVRQDRLLKVRFREPDASTSATK